MENSHVKTVSLKVRLGKQGNPSLSSNKGFDEDVKIPWPVARKGPQRETWS